MSRFGLVGPSYTSQSFNVDCQRTVNWMVERVESDNGKSAFALYPTPGMKVFCTLTDSPHRGSVFFNGRLFVIAGATLFEVFANGTFANRGAVANDGNPAYMVCGPSHLLIASSGNAYVMVLATNTITNLTAATTLPNIAVVGWSDGFFLALQMPQTNVQNKIFASAAGDGTTWPGTSFTAPSVFPDQVLGMLVDHREVLISGSKQSQFLYDSGNFPFPFDIIPGAFIDVGVSDPATMVRLDNSPFFIGQDERGVRVGWRIQGYNPIRVTNHAVETAWQSYPVDGTAVAYTFQYLGHLFWHVYFPTANSGNGASWRYDVATGMWHEVDHFTNGISKAHQSRTHAFAFGKHLVGANDSGTIYDMEAPVLSGSAWSFCDDAGNPIRRLRRTPVLSVENQWLQFSQLIVDVEAGLGPIPGLPGGQPSGAASLILADNTSALWSITISDSGPLVTTSVTIGTAQTLFLNDSVSGLSSWQITVSTSGILSTTSVTFSASYPQVIPMATVGNLQAGLSVDNNGLLQTQGFDPVPRDPQLMLRWSDTSGKTWSNINTLNCGQAGAFMTRAIQRRLGRSRNRVFELTATDPIPWRITDGYILGTGNQFQERLPKELAKRA